MAGVHPKLNRPGLGNVSADDELESLLQEQEAFRRDNKVAAAKLVRVQPSRSGQDKVNDSQHTANKAKQGSLFKQRRAAAAAAATAHPELAELPVVGTDGSTLSCLSDTVTERLEGDAGAVGRVMKEAPLTGFPVPSHRAFGKHLGKAPRASDGNSQGPSEDAALSEADAISAENAERLASTSVDEILTWQQELRQQLGADMCDFLKRRGQEKARMRGEERGQRREGDGTNGLVAGAGDSAAQKQEIAFTNGPVMGIALEPGDGLVAPSASELNPSFAAEAAAVMQALAGGCIDENESRKLQWTLPAAPADIDAIVSDDSLPPEPAGKLLQLLRFDFDGRICIRVSEEDGVDADQWDRSEGLHHHGAESSQAGYTFAELLLLSRSSHPPQRALAMDTLGRILLRARLPLQLQALTADPAARRVLHEQTMLHMPRAGFGTGASAFFWHVVSRSDIPKHIAEGLQDASLPVQVSALRASLALLDGSLPGSALDGQSLVGIRESGPQQHGQPGIMQMCALERCTVVAALFPGPMEVAGDLIWSSAPPSHALQLTLRACVAVFMPEEAGKGGFATFPRLLRSHFLGAKEGSEATAADVLDPLRLVVTNSKVEAINEDDEPLEYTNLPDPSAPKAFLNTLLQLLDRISGDHSTSSLVVRLLSILCSYSDADVSAFLSCSVRLRSQYVSFICELPSSGPPGQLKLESLRLLRRSCEAGGLSAMEWWLAGADSGHRLLTTMATLVRTAFDSCIAGHSVGIGSPSDASLHCALEVLRVWLAWLESGANIDGFMPSANQAKKLMGKLAAGPASEATLSDKSSLALLSLTLKLLSRCLVAVPQDGRATTAKVDPQSLQKFVDDLAPAVPAFAKSMLHGIEHRANSLVEELCLTSLLKMCEHSAAPKQNSNSACGSPTISGSMAITWSMLPETFLSKVSKIPAPDSSAVALAWGDAEAPWPLGSSGGKDFLAALVRLHLLEALCALAQVSSRCLSHQSSVGDMQRWLRGMVDNVLEAARCIEPEVPVPASSERMVGSPCSDPWASLLAAAGEADVACGAQSWSSAESPTMVQGYALAGCWATMHRLLTLQHCKVAPAAQAAILCAAHEPLSISCRQWQPVPDGGPPTMSFPASVFWAATASNCKPGEVRELLEIAVSPASKALASNAPPWLPFLAFVKMIATPMWGGEWAWKDDELLPLLESFAAHHLKAASWLPVTTDWLAETLRGLCDRVARVFSEESYSHKLVAEALWAFAAEGMPQECRAICAGSHDPILPDLLFRSGRLDTDHLLIFPLVARSLAVSCEAGDDMVSGAQSLRSAATLLSGMD